MNRVSVTFGTLLCEVHKINIPVVSCISDIRLWNCCIHSTCLHPTVAKRNLSGVGTKDEPYFHTASFYLCLLLCALP